MSATPVLITSCHPFSPVPPTAPQPVPPRCHTTPQQDRALEALGHAIEYLVDSRLLHDADAVSDNAAVHLLMICSRAIFAECDLVASLRQRVGNALSRHLHWKFSTAWGR